MDVRWTAVRKGNTGYVLEVHRDTNGEIVNRFNFQIPSNQVPAFIQGRKGVMRIVYDRINPDFTDEDVEAVEALEDVLCPKQS